MVVVWSGLELAVGVEVGWRRPVVLHSLLTSASPIATPSNTQPPLQSTPQTNPPPSSAFCDVGFSSCDSPAQAPSPYNRVSSIGQPPPVNSRKKAVFYGILYKRTRHKLKGCINDAKCMKYLLINKFKFPESSILMLTSKLSPKLTSILSIYFNFHSDNPTFSIIPICFHLRPEFSAIPYFILLTYTTPGFKDIDNCSFQIGIQ